MPEKSIKLPKLSNSKINFSSPRNKKKDTELSTTKTKSSSKFLTVP
jgi:hypothetical protein